MMLAIFWCASVIAAAEHPQQAAYEDGKVMFNNREYKLAIPYYEKIVNTKGKADVDAKAAYFLAESYFQIEDYVKAGPIFRDYLVRFPSHEFRAKAQFRFAEALYFQEEHETAARAFERFVQDNPKDDLVPEAIYRSATSLLDVGKSDEAAQLLDRLKRDFPTHPKVEEAMFFMAWAAFKEDRFAEAAESFFQFHKKFPKSDKSIEALLRAANAQFSATQYRKALELYNEVLRLGQGAFKRDSNTGIAWSYYKLNEFDKAGNYFLTLARNDDTREGKAEHYYQAIHSFYSGEAWDKGLEAIAEFFSQIKDHPLLGDAHYWRGLILIQKNDLVVAEKDLLQAANFESSKITKGEIYLELGNLYMKQANRDKALETLKTGLSIADKDSVKQQLRYELSRVLHLMNRTEEAIAYMEDNLKNIAQMKGEMALLSQFSMAEFHFVQKDYKAALSFYEKAYNEGGRELKLDALYKMGWCHRFLKNFEQANKNFAILLEMEQEGKPKYGQEVPYLIAQIYREIKQSDKATEWYVKVITSNEVFAAEASLALAEMKFEKGEHAAVVKDLKGFLVSYPNHALESNVRYLMAEAAYETGDVALAKQNYRKVIDSKQAILKEDALYGSAWILYENNEFDQALIDVDNLLKNYVETNFKKSAIQLKAKILRQLNRLDDAKQILSAGLKSMEKGEGEAILLDLAKIESELNHPDKALEIYNKLLHDFPNTELRGMVTYEKGWLYMGMDKPNEAFLMFKAYESSHPDGEFISDVQYVLGELAYGKEKYKEAIAYYEKSKITQRYKDRSLYKIAWSHIELENTNAAAETFGELVKECPDSSLLMEALYREGQSWLKALNFEKALQALSNFVERGKEEPFYGDALCDLGRVYEKQNQLGKAYDTYENYVKLFPNGERLTEMAFRMAKLNMQASKFSEARSNLKQALQSSAHALAPEAQYSEGECFFMEQRYNDAIGAFLKTEKFAFGEQWQAKALLKIAQCHRLLKNNNRAKEYLDRLLNQFPKSDVVEEAMQELRKLN